MRTTPCRPARTPGPLELHSGDTMSREEFHRIYEAMPDDFKAELIAEGGVFKSRLFPGLWVDGDALFAKDGLRLTATLARGLATADHAAFVSHLKTRPGGAT